MTSLLLRLHSAELSLMARLLRLKTPDWATLNSRVSVVTATRTSVMRVSLPRDAFLNPPSLLPLLSEFRLNLAPDCLSKSKRSNNNSNNNNARLWSSNNNNKDKPPRFLRLLNSKLKSVPKWSTPPSDKERPFASLKSPLSNVERDVDLGLPPSSRRSPTPACPPTDLKLSGFMRERYLLERSFLN